MSKRLWYNKISDDWHSALPLGNGRLASMFYGHPQNEHIQLNEESIWSGCKLEEKYETSPEIMEQIRQHLFNEEYEEAGKLSDKYFLTSPERVRTYQTAGDLFLDFDDKSEIKNYIKELNLENGIATCSYDKSGIHFIGECFISEKFDCICYKIKSVNGEKFSFNAKIERKKIVEANIKHCPQVSSVDDDTDSQVINVSSVPFGTVIIGQIINNDSPIYGSGSDGLRFGLYMHVTSDGTVTSKEDFVRVEDASEAVIFVDIETDYDVDTFDFDRNKDILAVLKEKISCVSAIDYKQIKSNHIEVFSEKFNTADINLGEVHDNIPTDERLKNIQNGSTDNDFYSLYFNYGRYLLLSSSGANATLPANLQGKWCNLFTPPWGSDYHTNINLQMNYWPAHTTNVYETVRPLVHFMKMLSKFGEDTAKKMYHCDGWVIHHTTDIYGRTGVHDSSQCGFFPMAGPWLCLNLWENYEFTGDKNYLETTLYPILKGSCEFLKNFLVESPDGYLVTNPSNSPENSFWYTDKNGEKKKTMFTYGATIDFEIIYAVFTRMIYAASLLGKDDDFSNELKDILNRIPPLKISKRYGTVCEWIKDYEEEEPNHRHISHMFALYPSDQINESNPEIFEGAKKTIARRLSHGGGATGWSRAWIINFYARLKDGENAFEHLTQLMKKSTIENLFDMHPPFQIDGNFGGTSGIAEMLLQSHEGAIGERVISLLPALPNEWKDGSFKGLCARGNFEIDANWSDGKVTYIKIHAHCGGKCRVKFNEIVKEFNFAKGENKIIEL